MKPYWIKTTNFIKRLFHNQVWDISNTENKIFLTFDDGPTPEITTWVLSILKEYNIKATFFCIGQNIKKHPDIFAAVIADGHAIGNHTFNHLNGWKISDEDYIRNIELCQNEILFLQSKICNLKSNIFRPPYGKIKPSQSKKLRQLGYKIIMWDVLSADFDKTISPEQCLENATKKVTSGSIIVFHDSIKASENLKFTLPKAIKILIKKGFSFDVINDLY